MQNLFQTANQKFNSPDLLVAMAVLLHELVAKRVKCVLKHNRARVPIIQNSNFSPNFAIFCYPIFFVIVKAFSERRCWLGG